MLRNVIGLIVGIFAGGAFNMAIITLSQSLYPPPEGMTPSDFEAFKAYVQSLPPAAFLLVLLAHAGGAMVGGFVAGGIAMNRHLLLGALVGAFFLAGGLFYVMQIPSPVWFAIADTLLYLPCGVLGAYMARTGIRYWNVLH